MDYKKLSLGEKTSVFTGISVQDWGSQVIIDCLYDPTGVAKKYQMVFNQCREIHWSLMDEAQTQDLTADLIGFHLGVQDYEEAAVITTDLLELTILYENFSLRSEDSFEAIGPTKEFTNAEVSRIPA